MDLFYMATLIVMKRAVLNFSALVILQGLITSDSKVVLQTRLVHFQNPENRDANWACCVEGTSDCRHECASTFTICLSTVARSGDCIYVHETTDQYVYGKNVNFGEVLKGGIIKNPLVIEMTELKDLYFAVQVEGNSQKSIATFVENPLVLKVYAGNKSQESQEKVIVLKRGRYRKELKVIFKLYCQENYLLPDCQQYCQPNDDDVFGHYQCVHHVGKVCLPDWIEPETNCTRRNQTLLSSISTGLLVPSEKYTDNNPTSYRSISSSFQSPSPFSTTESTFSTLCTTSNLVLSSSSSIIGRITPTWNTVEHQPSKAPSIDDVTRSTITSTEQSVSSALYTPSSSSSTERTITPTCSTMEQQTFTTPSIIYSTRSALSIISNTTVIKITSTSLLSMYTPSIDSSTSCSISTWSTGEHQPSITPSFIDATRSTLIIISNSAVFKSSSTPLRIFLTSSNKIMTSSAETFMTSSWYKERLLSSSTKVTKTETSTTNLIPDCTSSSDLSPTPFVEVVTNYILELVSSPSIVTSDVSKVSPNTLLFSSYSNTPAVITILVVKSSLESNHLSTKLQTMLQNFSLNTFSITRRSTIILNPLGKNTLQQKNQPNQHEYFYYIIVFGTIACVTIFIVLLIWKRKKLKKENRIRCQLHYTVSSSTPESKISLSHTNNKYTKDINYSKGVIINGEKVVARNGDNILSSSSDSSCDNLHLVNFAVNNDHKVVMKNDNKVVGENILTSNSDSSCDSLHLVNFVRITEDVRKTLDGRNGTFMMDPPPNVPMTSV